MSEAIIVAIITGLLSLAGSALGVWASSRKQTEEFKQEFKVQQAITTEQIKSLTAEVREHNNFARRMPVVEEQIKVINHRIQDLEDDAK